MGNDIKTAIRPALIFIILLTLVTGLIYPLFVLGLGQAIFPYQSNGSLVRDRDRIVGSELIGQNFARPDYFHPRPSAAGDGYDAAASSGSNLGPTSADLKTAIEERVATARTDGAAGAVPADAVTASGSGLDPDISPQNAMMQANRIATARGIPVEKVRELIVGETRAATFGVLGEPHVNVLALNRQLDRLGAEPRR
jgi:K+-transporting ATPase ATPase C chain